MTLEIINFIDFYTLYVLKFNTLLFGGRTDTHLQVAFFSSKMLLYNSYLRPDKLRAKV
jgi:hypothetical protein